MKVLESYDSVKSALIEHLENLSTCLHSDQNTFKYTKEEEQSLAHRANEMIEQCTSALGELQEYVRGHKKSDLEAILQDRQRDLKNIVLRSKKLLIDYRDGLKKKKLLEPAIRHLGPGIKSRADNGNAMNVLASLQRTHKVMSNELDRVGSVSKVLDEGRQSLQESQDEYGTVTGEIKLVRRQLKTLEWQAKKDRMWVAAGICILFMTIMHIVCERSGIPALFS